RLLSPGNNSLDHFGIGSKSGRTFARIKHAEPAASARADIKESATLLQSGGNETDSMSNLLLFRQQSRSDHGFLCEHQFDPSGQGKLMQIFRPRISLLGPRFLRI